MTKLEKVYLKFEKYTPREGETPMYLTNNSGLIYDLFFIEDNILHTHLGNFPGNETWIPVLPIISDSNGNIIADIKNIHYLYVKDGILHDHSFFYKEGVLETINIFYYNQILENKGECYMHTEFNFNDNVWQPVRVDNYLILQLNN